MSEAASPKYSARVLWSDEDQVFIATCPELFEVSTHGATPDEAVRELQVVIELVLETREEEEWPFPEPHRWHAHSGQFRLRLPKSLHAWLAEEANREGVSLNTFVVARLSEVRGARGEA